MKQIRKMLALMVVTMLMMCCFAIPVSAAGGNGNTAEPDSTGLITSYTHSLSSGNSRVLINARISASETMAKLGFKDIIIQKSTSSSGSWSTYFAPSDQLAENVKKHYLDDFLISVPGGYYYRVQLTFYAKEQGWFFPSSESITVTTNTVYVA